MLFAVEGGGFLSSSASGYSSGLALLVFGQKNEDRNIKVPPWNQYHLVHQELNHAHQRCSSFTCFGCVSSRNDRSLNPESSSSPNHSDNSIESSSDRAEVAISVCSGEIEKKIWLKSSLKKPSTSCCVIVNEDDALCSEDIESNTSCFSGRRKVQWSDTCGKELTEIREFELSDDGISDDETEPSRARRCECVIQ